MKATMLLSRSLSMGIASGVLIAVCAACVTPPSATLPDVPATAPVLPKTPTPAPSPIASPTIPAVSRTMPFEIVAEGAPFVGKGRAPILRAIRGDDPKRVVPDDLPEQAKEILHRIFATPTPNLYLVIYTGLGGTRVPRAD